MNGMNLLLVILAIIVIVVVLKKMNNKEGFDTPDIQTGAPSNAQYADTYLPGGDGGNDYTDLVGEYY